MLALALGGTGALGMAAQQPARAQASSSLSDAQGEVSRLEEEKRIFDSVDPSDPQSVQQAQQVLLSRGLNVRVDGTLGPETAGAISQYRQQVSADLDAARARLGEVETADRVRRYSPEDNPTAELLPLLALGGAALLGHGSRGLALMSEGRKLARRTGLLNRLVSTDPLPGGASRAAREARATRAANVNEFWRQGGAQATPFAETPNGAFRRRAGATDPTELFPQTQASRLRMNDYAITATSAGESAFAYQQHQVALQELQDAEIAAQENPSEQNLARLQRARQEEERWNLLWRAGAGFAVGRLSGSLAHKYPTMRPNVAGAEAERMMLNEYLAAQRSASRSVNPNR